MQGRGRRRGRVHVVKVLLALFWGRLYKLEPFSAERSVHGMRGVCCSPSALHFTMIEPMWRETGSESQKAQSVRTDRKSQSHMVHRKED